MRIPLFRANKEQSRRITAKYSRINQEDYLEAATSASAKLYDRVPGTPAEQSKKQSAASRRVSYVKDLVHESIVSELDKSGFIKQGLQSMKKVILPSTRNAA